MTDDDRAAGPTLPPGWWVGVLLAFVVLGAAKLYSSTSTGLLPWMVGVAPNVAAVIVMFVVLIGRHRDRGEPMTPWDLAKYVGMSIFWPLTIVIWLVSNRGMPPSPTT